MSDATELMIRNLADILFNKAPTHSTKDIFDKIDKKEYEANLEKVTQFVLKEMYCENTGSHFLDSGGAYGRGYDSANAVKHLDWMKQKPAIAVVDQYSRDGSYDFYVQKNAYLFLVESLEYDLEMDQRFHKFCQSEKEFVFTFYDKHMIPTIACEALDKYSRIYGVEKGYQLNKKRVEYFSPKDESYYKCISAWKDLLSQADAFEDLEDYEDLKGYNTANGETCLNKTLQWEMFTIHNGKYEGHYIILQIHNGCDIRGGYSTPHIFKYDEDQFWCKMDDITARCTNFNYGEKGVPGIQVNLDNKPTKDPVVDLDHVDCYSDDCGRHWYGSSGEDVSKGAEFKTDEEGKHHIVCKKCGAELEFW